MPENHSQRHKEAGSSITIPNFQIRITQIAENLDNRIPPSPVDGVLTSTNSEKSKTGNGRRPEDIDCRAQLHVRELNTLPFYDSTERVVQHSLLWQSNHLTNTQDSLDHLIPEQEYNHRSSQASEGPPSLKDYARNNVDWSIGDLQSMIRAQRTSSPYSNVDHIYLEQHVLNPPQSEIFQPQNMLKTKSNTYAAPYADSVQVLAGSVPEYDDESALPFNSIEHIDFEHQLGMWECEDSAESISALNQVGKEVL